MSMPNLALPPVAASGVSRTQAPAGARHAEQNDTRGFEKALEASRGARTRTPGEASDAAGETTAADGTEGIPSRKGTRDDERKGSTLTPAEVMAMLAPYQPAAMPARTDAGASANTSAADGQGPGGAARLADAALPGLASQAAAAFGDDATDGPAADSTATPSSTDASDKANRATTTVAALGANAAPASPPPTLAETAVALAAARAVPGVVPDAAPSTARTPAKGRVGDASSAATTATIAADTDAPSAASSAGASPQVEFQAALAAASGGTTSGNDGNPEGDDAQAATPLPLQAGAASTATTDRTGAVAATAAPAPTVAPEVGHEAWAAALAQQVLRMSTSGQHVARLNLNPAELGPLQVTLSMNDQQTQAMFMSSHEGVRKALEAALPQLRSTLAAQGIELGQASVNSGASQQFGGQGSSFGGQDSPRPRTPVDYPGAIARADSQPAQAGAASVQRARSPGGLDTFA